MRKIYRKARHANLYLDSAVKAAVQREIKGTTQSLSGLVNDLLVEFLARRIEVKKTKS